MYTMTLTKQEYQDACYMDARGYLGGIIEHATTEEWADDESRVMLTFTEADALEVQQQCEDDPDAVWALTSPSTALGQKFQHFLDSIV